MALQRRAATEARSIEGALQSQRAKAWRERPRDGPAGVAGFIHRMPKWKASVAPTVGVRGHKRRHDGPSDRGGRGSHRLDRPSAVPRRREPRRAA
eukprot:6295545-Pyramimonas_sp.AAC.1